MLDARQEQAAATACASSRQGRGTRSAGSSPSQSPCRPFSPCVIAPGVRHPPSSAQAATGRRTSMLPPCKHRMTPSHRCRAAVHYELTDVAFTLSQAPDRKQVVHWNRGQALSPHLMSVRVGGQALSPASDESCLSEWGRTEIGHKLSVGIGAKPCPRIG